MGIVAAEESRIGQHDVYLPALNMPWRTGPICHPMEMGAAREMTNDHVGSPAGGSHGAAVHRGARWGPPAAACTFAAWSPDGKWMYFNSNR